MALLVPTYYSPLFPLKDFDGRQLIGNGPKFKYSAGLLCTMSAARVIGLDVTDVPLHIYGPPGLSEFIR